MLADTSSWMRPGAIAASWARQLGVRLLEEVDLREHRSCEVSDTADIDEAKGCLGEH